jgi:hypothetical protein
LERNDTSRKKIMGQLTKEQALAMAAARLRLQESEEAAKEEGPGGYIPFLNKTLAGIGAGVDLFAGALRNSPYPGQFSGQPPPEKVGGLAAAIPEDSFGGTQSVRRGMANIGAPTPDRGPRTTLEYMGQATGDGALLAIPGGFASKALSKTNGWLGGLAREGREQFFRRGMRLKDARNTMAEKAYEAATSGAAKAAGVGAVGGAAAGAARQQAERHDLGPTQTMLAEMASGVAAISGPRAALKLATKTPGLRMMKGLGRRLATPFFDEPAWQQASDIMRSQFDDPQDAINQVKATRGTSMMSTTATENPGAMGLAQTVMDMNAPLKERISKETSEAVQSLAESIKGTGNPQSTRDFVYHKRQTLFKAMTARVEVAAERARVAVEAVKANSSDARVITAKAMQEAEADVKLQRKAIWDGIDQDGIKVTIRNQVAAYNEALAKISPGINEQNIPNDIREILDTVSTHRTVRANYALYKKLGRQIDNDLSKQGGKQNTERAGVLLGIQEAVMKDMETQAGTHADLRTAIDFSNMEINTFRKGPVGAILGYQANLFGEPLPLSLGLERTLVSGQEGNLARGRIQRAAEEGDRARTSLGKAAPGGPASVNVAEGMQDYLKQEFVKYATKDGVVDPNAARLFLRDRAELMDSFPTLKKQLEAARKTEDVARRVTSETDAQRTRFNQKDLSKTAQLLGGPLDVQVGKIMASGDPTQAMWEAVKIVKRDPTGKALAGLQHGFGQFLIRDIMVKQTDAGEKLVLNGVRLRANLKMPEFIGPMKVLYDDKQMKNLEMLADHLAKYYIQQQHNKAVPLLGGQASWLIDFASGTGGAWFGRMLNTGTITVPGRAASLSTRLAKYLTTNKVAEFLTDAIVSKDPDLMIALLRGRGTVKDERVLRSWMLGTGARLFEDDESTEN